MEASMLAQRTGLFGASGTAAARAAAKAAAANGNAIIDLTCGEIVSDLAPTIRSGAVAAIQNGVNRYTDTIGMPELREALARKVSLETGQIWQTEEIAVTTGAKQALFNAAMVLLNPGDEVLIPAPYWTTFPAQIAIADAKAVFVDTRQTGFVPTISSLERAMSARTRAIVINTPSNPTSAVYDHDTLAAIARLAISHDLWVIFDECYRAFTYDTFVHHPITAIVPEVRQRTVIVNAFSKELAITGWRIGYLAAPRQVISAVKAFQSHTTSNPNVIAQHAVLTHLRDGDSSFERSLRGSLAMARTRGLRLLSRIKRLPTPKAEGGFYFYLDLSHVLAPGETADDVVNRMLSEVGVAGVSGTAFGDPMGLRLSYGVPVEQLEIGLERLLPVLNDWH
jgi:aspartate aminotransferase